MKDQTLCGGALLLSLTPGLADCGSDSADAAASGAELLDRVPFAPTKVVPPTAQRCN